jgi:spermidine synthase
VSLSVDGKVDASTSGDMITQKLLAHLPLLLHPNPRDVAVVGLGSGVTVGAALRHPIASAEVIELSPEVVEASQFFTAQNHEALKDARTRLIVGDARSHLLLGSRKYDVLISEPSNPWMAGVAALFTREFFEAMRERLAPGGLVCQWAHTYDIADADLRSIVATFTSVFPNTMLWLIGQGDVLMIGGDQRLDQRLAEIVRTWQRPGVARDLAETGARDPFALLSTFLAGPAQLRRYTMSADVQRDDRLRLEFSGPAGLYNPATAANVMALRGLRNPAEAPSAVAAAFTHATAAEWRNRAAMMARLAAYDEAFDNYTTALTLDATDSEALAGIVPVAVAAHREDEAVGLLESVGSAPPGHARARTSLAKLLAARGAVDEAIAQATEACRLAPSDLAAWEQLASIFSDVGDAEQLDRTVATMRRIDPHHGGTLYYAAASHFLHGRLEPALETVQAAIAVDSRRAAAQNLLGAIHASMGNVAAARRAFADAMARDPRDSATYTNLARLELHANNLSAASRWFGEALSLDPASAAAREGLRQSRSAAGGR